MEEGRPASLRGVAGDGEGDCDVGRVRGEGLEWRAGDCDVGRVRGEGLEWRAGRLKAGVFLNRLGGCC